MPSCFTDSTTRPEVAAVICPVGMAHLDAPTVDVLDRVGRRERALQHLGELERPVDRRPEVAVVAGARTHGSRDALRRSRPAGRRRWPSASTRRASIGRLKASQSATSTPATQMAPKAATTTAVVIPLSFPCVAPYAGNGHLVYGVAADSRNVFSLAKAGGVRYTPRPQVAGFNPCHWFVTTIDQER